jgi:hypothetical protein
MVVIVDLRDAMETRHSVLRYGVETLSLTFALTDAKVN